MTEQLAVASRTRGCCQELVDPLSDVAVQDGVAILRALADPTRIRMLAILASASEAVCVCDFTAAFELSQPTVSHHLGKLREAGLVTSHKRGIWMFYEAAPDMPRLAREVISAVAAG